ncbi:MULTISPECIES: hypothetical protein [unclassified Pseudomonas]|uniref:hypothetical protein n=1 Tax=unclassified Pseudomonas TaxID=196821 RepID=UPI0006D40E4C|nr:MULTISPECIES: hypothetical protein [unclassified Pseudomonas]
MPIFASIEQRCFYNDELSAALPTDAKEISYELHQSLLSGQAEGKFIDFSIHPPRLVKRVAAWPTAEELSARIDEKVAFVYATWIRFEPEYSAREKAAIAYRQAGYEGEASRWVERYADAVGIAVNAAADLILERAAQRENALEALADARLRKHELQMLNDEARQARYQEIIEQIATVNGLLETFDNLPSKSESHQDLRTPLAQ